MLIMLKSSYALLFLVTFYSLASFWVFFFSSRRRHTRLVSDWSSDGALPICGERQHDEPVPGLPQHGALLRDDALDGELRAADPDRAADGELRGAEQLVRYVEAEHRDRKSVV